MRRAASLLAAAAIAAVGVPALADGALSAPGGAVPAFDALPEGSLPGLPSGPPPATIPATERVAGLFGAGRPTDDGGMFAQQGRGFISLFGDEEQATTFAGGGPQPIVGNRACLIDGGNSSVLERQLPRSGGPSEWPANFGAQLSLQFELDPPPAHPTAAILLARRLRGFVGGNVHAVRSERFIAGEGGRASLRVVDAWFDARTRGARLIHETTLPLARIFVGPNHLEVYAARDGQGSQLVLHAGELPALNPLLAPIILQRVRFLSVSLPNHQNANSNNCGHVRFVLRAPPGGGEMATLQSVAFLPPVDGEVVATTDGAADQVRGQQLFQAMRQRPFELSVSVTALSGQKTPLLSVAVGWSGRERAVQ